MQADCSFSQMELSQDPIPIPREIDGGEHGQGCLLTGLEGQSSHKVAKLPLHTRETYKNTSHHCCTDNQKIRVNPENRKTGHIKMGCNLRDILLAVGQVSKR